MLTEKTSRFDIYMAGDVVQAKQVCREFCFEVGECVHIERVEFIYTGGEEAGFKVGFIRYPRIPRTDEELRLRAHDLAQRLLTRLCQHSFCVVGPEETEWFTRREHQ